MFTLQLLKVLQAFVIFLIVVVLPTEKVYGAMQDVNQKKTFIGFSGILGSGIDNGTALDYWGGKPYNSSYGFGVVIEYSFNKSFRLFFDANYYTLKVLQAKKDETIYSFWVFEQTNYTNGYIGPMPTDVYYYMDATVFRLGGKYQYSIGKKMDLWYGLGIGFCGWKASYDNQNRSKTYGGTNGTLISPFYLMLGLDVKIQDDMKFTIFFDGGSPVTKVKINNLFNDGWIWECSKHIMAPYRLGISIAL